MVLVSSSILHPKNKGYPITSPGARPFGLGEL